MGYLETLDGDADDDRGSDGGEVIITAEEKAASKARVMSIILNCGCKKSRHCVASFILVN